MIGLRLRVLGSGSAIPTLERNSSAHLLYAEQTSFLIDCGEGTQHQLLKYNESPGRIEHILISHLHGDHFFGLPGLLSTFKLQGRTKALHIYGPSPTESVITTFLENTYTILDYPVFFHLLDPKQKAQIFQNHQLKVFSFPLEHRQETYGYLIQEIEKEANLNKDFVKKYQPSIGEMKAIKKGADYSTAEGKVLLHKDITTAAPFPLSYAYCSDTRYMPQLHKYFPLVTLLYHEASFTKEDTQLAVEKAHSSSEQAALVAKDAEAKQLLIAHFSNRYNDTKVLEKDAKAVFQNTIIAEDGMNINLQEL
jgi:ribonuclease Z